MIVVALTIEGKFHSQQVCQTTAECHECILLNKTHDKQGQDHLGPQWQDQDHKQNDQ